ncbi:MAG: hypothetical protein ACOC28_04460 [Alkalispirochaetaceae bacterium]
MRGVVDWEELQRVESVETRPLSFREEGPFILTGDVVGGSGGETLLPLESGWLVANGRGEPLGRIESDPDRWKPLVLTDWDGDGKEDLLLGDREPPGVTLRVVSGTGRLLFERTLLSVGEAVLQKARVDSGILTFIAYPSNRSAPRLLGAVRVGESGERCNYATLGPLPVDLSKPVERGGRLVYGVTLRGAREGCDGYLPEVAPEPDRLRRLLLRVSDSREPELSVELGPPIGPPVRHGFFREGQISRLEQIPVAPRKSGRFERSAESESTPPGPRVLLLKERLSPVYGGPSELELRDMDNELLARLEGPESTRGQLLPVRIEGERRLLLVWSRTGEVVLLTENLEVLSRRDLAPEAAQLRLRTADREGPPFLLTAGRSAWVLGAALETLWTGEARRVIRDGLLSFPRRSDASVTLLAAGAERFATPRARPRAGAAGSPEHQAAAQIAAPEAWPSGAARTAEGRLRIEPPDGFRYYQSAHLDEDQRPDHLFLDGPGARYIVYGSPGAELARGYTPRAMQRPGFVGDLDGDGAEEMLGTFHEEGDRGAVLFSPMAPEHLRERWTRLYSFGYDSSLGLLGHFGDLLLLRMTNGYMLSPRGAYGVEGTTGEIRFFRPSGGFTFLAHLGPDGAIYFDTATPSNGNVVRQEEGFLDVDAYTYRHVIDQQGNPTAAAGPLPDSLGQGGGRYFFFDSDGDGTEEAYLSIQKDPDFYPGRTRVIRIYPDGETATVFSGPEDTHNSWYPIDYQGERLLFVRFPQKGIVRQMTPEFEPLRSWDVSELKGGPVAQLTTGGAPCFLHLREGALVAWNLLSGEERAFRIEGEDVISHRILKGRDGSRELLLLGESAVEAIIQ